MQTPKQNTPDNGEHNYNPMQSARALSNAGMDNTLAQTLAEQIADAHNKGRREFLAEFARIEQRLEEGQEKSEQRFEKRQKESEQRFEKVQEKSERRLEKELKELRRLAFNLFFASIAIHGMLLGGILALFEYVRGI